MPQFMQGIDLNRLFFQQVIKPLMDEHFPDVPYSAGIIGEGSDVLRFDTPQSMDHNWGPHMRIFLSEYHYRTKKDAIDEMFKKKLPFQFMGFPTNFTPESDSYLVQEMKPTKTKPINHLIKFFTIRSFFEYYLGFDPYNRITIKDWLTFPQQALLEVTKGEVYYDGLGELERIRAKFHYYPDDVWLYMYMIQWEKIANEEAFMGRSGEVGDELGSNIIATSIVTNIMKLCFLIEKQYIPYVKWFGTAFSRLRSANELTHILLNGVHGRSWEEREKHLAQAYEIIVRMHNDLKITKPIKTEVSDFHGRPYKVIKAGKVIDLLYEKLDNPALKNLKYHFGAIDQWVDRAFVITRMNYVYKEFKRLIKRDTP